MCDENQLEHEFGLMNESDLKRVDENRLKQERTHTNPLFMFNHST